MLSFHIRYVISLNLQELSAEIASHCDEVIVVHEISALHIPPDYLENSCPVLTEDEEILVVVYI